ncbi:hypothetical protein LOD99_5173 [Oopsacas minuta]|uniref:Calx-beta domain-containing protein n=1 Tax=Oopsacas minuta TaxID=111878 RepID=A0AAV7JT08_9METZ|nr:hypothetical protein LOD99_5173 [Oopsacas minuta]
MTIYLEEHLLILLNTECCPRVQIVADNVPELGELFRVTLTGLSLLNMSVTNPMNIPSFGDVVEASIEIARSDYPNGLFRVSLAGDIHSLVIKENYTDLIIGTIYRDHGTFGTVSVHYSLVGSATSVLDFALAEATFVFNPGEDQKPLSFFIEEDNIAEGDETIIIQLDEPTGGAEIIKGIGSSVTVQIDANDNGGGIISFAIESLNSVVEEDRSNPIQIIRKVGSAGQALVTWVLTGYRVEEEFTNTSGTALFEDGLAYTFIYLLPRDDALPETPQVYILNITGVTSVDIAQTGGAILDPDTSLLSAVITLAESDMPHGVVELTSSQVVYTLGEGTTSTILVSRMFGVLGDLRLYYESEIGNLTSLNPVVGPEQRSLSSQSDITAGVQSLIIPDGVTSLILPLTVVDDNVPEFAEVFILKLVSVELTDPPNTDPAALKPPTLGEKNLAEIYIPQNDGPQGILQFLFGSLEVQENAGVLNVTVARVGGSFGPASCRVEITGMPNSLPLATRDIDYLFQSVSLSWSDGELGSREIEVEILEDELAESREVINIGLTEELPSGVIRGENSTLTIIILGSDLGRGVFSIDPTFPEVSLLLEGTILQIPILRTFSSLGEVMLQYRVLPTILPADLAPAVGQVLFQDGQTTGNLVLDIVADGIAELVEQFVVEILPPVSPEGTLLGNRTSVEVHVSESDNPYGRFQAYLLQPDGQISLNYGLVEEDSDLIQIVIDRKDGLNAAVSVDWELFPDTATSNYPGDQYTLSTTQRLSSSSEWLSFFGNEAGNEYAISVDGDTSRLYSWRGIYEHTQTFNVLTATSWHSFPWSNKDYLVVSSYTNSIELFQYNSTSLSYSSIQSISQARVSHLHTFSTDGLLYLFACIFSDVSGDTDTSSILYVWDSATGLFSEQNVQQIVTRGAEQALTFESDNSLYLIIANSYDTAQQTSDTPSTLYQWSTDNTRLVLYTCRS